ncbi:MAG: UDP-N-acetylmuramoyl-L-alanyl-D-glutamate--2,6-diaminopimelate ligase [Microscillaceae bacterium]
MPSLSDLLQGVDVTLVRGDVQEMMTALHFDSRQVQPQSVFIAIAGLKHDGHDFIPAAIEAGASAILCETLPETLFPDITYLLTPNASRALGQMAAAFYGHPSKKLKVVGITGTNGKTTTATLLFRLFRELGYRTGLISTVQNQIDEEVLPTHFTTPDALTLQALLAEMVQKGCTHCFMEVSSHALAQERVAGLQFSGAVFTNITHDHLDFHQTFDNYIQAKKKLFDELPRAAFALVNIDDKRGRVMLQNCAAHRQKTFALKNLADFKARLLENTLQGLLLELENQEVWFRLIGEFNAYNLLGVYGAACLLGEPASEVLTILSGLPAAPGRFEQVASPQGTIGIVDYAHTPDALENVLQTIIDLRQAGQKIITVVGCGGDRDKSKRPVMARTAGQYSDWVILTSDNPRSEEPQDILDQMWAGLSTEAQTRAEMIVRREAAIQKACQMARAHDIVLVAGKGHESYQEIKGQRFDFDDRKMLAHYFALSS